LLLEVVAFRDIEPGEEIFINCELSFRQQGLC
jgi:hypothetical protein